MLGKLAIEGDWFVDARGRRHLLRGVNLGGDCKVPYPNGGTHQPTDFSDHRMVSFVGRPFPLKEADEHLARLKAWGFNVLRLLTTWEAAEHEGPGRYDEAYLDYFAEICRRAEAYGLYVFIDFHQDVWSRMSGGDGAPGWTFEAAGLDFTRFDAAGAAQVMQYKYDFARGGRQEDRYPEMSWSHNYRYPANGIMWTLFFAGNTFCPDLICDDVPIQDYLQTHYLGAMRAVAERVADIDHVIGFDSLNEPGSGFVGRALSARPLGAAGEAPARPGLAMSVLDALLIASGVPRSVPRFALDREAMKVVPVGEETLNVEAIPIWTSGACPFERAGAYGFDGASDIRTDEAYFCERDGHRFDMDEDFMAPFFAKVADTVREQRPDWLLFAELDPQAGPAAHFPGTTPSGTVNASHWYDTVTLSTKTFTFPKKINPYTGRSLDGAEAIESAYERQLGRIKSASRALNGGNGAPTLIGEFGIPFDLNGAEAYRAWAAGDRSNDPWGLHVTALELMYNALDRLLLHATQWNYTASNSNDLAVGDQWNQEDLSIFSRDQQTDETDIMSGGRAMAGFVRPFARIVAGRPQDMRFEREKGRFRLLYEAEGEEETEIFVPGLQYPNGYEVTVSGAEEVARDGRAQTLTLRNRAGSGVVTVTLSRR